MVTREAGHVLVVSCTMMLVFGTLNALMKDWQVKMGFFVPYLWTFGTFVGQIFVLPIHCAVKRDDDSSSDKSNPPATVYVITLVTSFAFAALCFNNCAYSGVPGSTLQVLKGLKLILTVLLSYVFLGKRVLGHQCLGVTLVIAGVVLAGYAACHAIGWSTVAKSYISIMVAFGSSLVGAFEFVLEEKTLRHYALGAEMLAVMQGVIGAGFAAVVLVAVNVMHVGDTHAALVVMLQDKTILLAFLVFVAAVAAFNYSALVVTQHSSAIIRSLLDVGRTVCVACVEIFCTWRKFSWIELLGFILVVCGTMVYGKIFKVPCLDYVEEQPLIPMKQNG